MLSNITKVTYPLSVKHVCRRLLAVFELPSWGRCELVLSLLRDPSATYTLEDVVQAVRESPDRDFIRRVLNKECPICLSVFPHSKVLCISSSFMIGSESCTFSESARTLGLVSSEHTAYCGHTHPEQWATILLWCPGLVAVGVRWLAQGHLSHFL